MFGFRVVRMALSLGLLGLFLVAGSATVQTKDKLIERLLKEARSRPRLKPKSDEDPLRRLLIQRYNVSLDEVQQRCEDFTKGLSSLEKVIQSAQDQLTAELEMLTDPQEKIKALEHVIEIIRWHEGELEKGLKDGIGLRAEVLRVRHKRLTREIEVLRIKQKVRAVGG